MIAESPLQFCAGQSLPGKKSGKRAVALLRLRGKGRDARDKECPNRESSHETVLAIAWCARKAISLEGAAVFRSQVPHRPQVGLEQLIRIDIHRDGHVLGKRQLVQCFANKSAQPHNGFAAH